MIDLVRKIQAEKDAVPKCKAYRAKRPMFSHATIKIFRCVIDNPGICANEAVVKTGLSKAFASYSMLEFYNQGLMTRTVETHGCGIQHRYSHAGSKISAIELLSKEEARLNTPQITGRMQEIINLVGHAGRCTADKIAKHLGIRDQNARAYINKLVKINMISKVDSEAKGSKYQYMGVEA